MIRRFGFSYSLSVCCYVFVWGWRVPEQVDFFNTDKKGKHLYLAGRAVKDRKILGWMVQRPVCPLSHLPCTKAASARRLALSQFLTVNSKCTKRIWVGTFWWIFKSCSTSLDEYKWFKIYSKLLCHWLHNFTPHLIRCTGVDRLDKDLTIGQMQGEELKFFAQNLKGSFFFTSPHRGINEYNTHKYNIWLLYMVEYTDLKKYP